MSSPRSNNSGRYSESDSFSHRGIVIVRRRLKYERIIDVQRGKGLDVDSIVSIEIILDQCAVPQASTKFNVIVAFRLNTLDVTIDRIAANILRMRIAR